jgi:hypothetical protein
LVKTPKLYFLDTDRDHHGIEVDFLLPIGKAVRLVECKWSETPSTRVRGFDDLEARGVKVISKTLVTPWRGRRRVGDVTIADCVDPSWVDVR